MEKPSEEPKSEEKQKKQPEKEPAEEKDSLDIPLVEVPDDAELLEEEMMDIFNEDQVKHQQGPTEPERD